MKLGTVIYICTSAYTNHF